MEQKLLNQNKTTCYLSTAYWGPVQYFTKFLIYNPIIIEQFESYPKQTYRNRCLLYGPNGVQSLQVPVEMGSFHKINTRDVKIAYHMPWQKNHLQTIQTAYKSSPYYEYYIDDIIPFYEKKTTFLIELNQQITKLCCKWMKLDNTISLSTEFDKTVEGSDLRFTIHPKIQKQEVDPIFKPAEYHQVFNAKFGFQENLSVIDLIMNCGPEAKHIMLAGIKS